MSIPNELATAEQVAAEGYFDKCAGGDMRACSLFARLVAHRLNPNGDPNSWGWLSKNAGESNQDGFSDDGMVYGNNGQNNVIDLVGGSGAPGARVQWGGPHPRRPTNLWVAPKPLTAAELNYLKPGAQPPGPKPPVPPQPPTLQYPGDDKVDPVGAVIFADFAKAGQLPNPQMFRWAFRIIWDHVNGDGTRTFTFEESVQKHRAEMRDVLGLPPV